MAVTTIFRIAEECLKMLSGGSIQTATNISMSEIKISIGQVVNGLLKIEHFGVNEKMGEKIPNGSVLGWYEDIEVTSRNGTSIASMPIKPIKLPRNMGCFGVYPKFTSLGYYEMDKEFIPLQMGQSSLLKSQSQLSTLLGQVGYEPIGNMDIKFTKDIKSFWPEIKLAMRLAIMDISQYDDYTPLPILPEQEWQIKQEVIKLYSGVGVADLLVDNLTKQQQNVPIDKQKQSP